MRPNLDCKSYKLENHPVTVFELTGQIDSPESLTAVREGADGSETEHVALLMEGVMYINSRGCGELIVLHHSIEKRGFRMFIVKPVGGTAKVLEHMGADRIISVKESLEEVMQEIET